MVDITIRFDYDTEEELFNSFIWDKYLCHAVGFSVCESFQIVDDTYRRQLRSSFAMARINGVDTSALLGKYGYAKFSEVPDSVLPVLEVALADALQKPEPRAQETYAEQIAKLLQTSTEGDARTVFVFANTLLRRKQ